MGSPSPNKFKGAKQTHSLSTFQNGRFAGKGAFSMVREDLRISVPMFRSRPSTSHFHKAFESPNVAIKEIDHYDYNLPRRHANSRENQEADHNSKR